VVLLQTPDLNVLRAADTALSTSSAVAAGIVPILLPEEGEYTSKVFPLTGLVQAPPMYSCRSGIVIMLVLLASHAGGSAQAACLQLFDRLGACKVNPQLNLLI